MGSGISYSDSVSCFECIGEWRVVCIELSVYITIHTVYGFDDINGDTITELLVSELGLRVGFQVTFTVIKGNRPVGFRQVAITSTPITASATAGSRSDQPT